MSGKTFGFGAQKNVGDKGETAFLEKYTSYEKLGKKDDYDFQDPLTLHKVELKTDTYPLSKTENHFIERFSDDNTYKPGGPFRCTEDNSTFVYYHIKDDVAFFYNPQKLVEIINKELKISKLVSIRNKGYNTLGFKVPRVMLEPALIRKENLKCSKPE